MGQKVRRPIDLVGHARQDHLTRRVVVRHHQVELVLPDEGQDQIGFSGNGQHGAVITFALRHELTP